MEFCMCSLRVMTTPPVCRKMSLQDKPAELSQALGDTPESQCAHREDRKTSWIFRGCSMCYFNFSVCVHILKLQIWDREKSIVLVSMWAWSGWSVISVKICKFQPKLALGSPMDEPNGWTALDVLNSVLGAGYKNEPCSLRAGQRASSKRRSWESPQWDSGEHTTVFK